MLALHRTISLRYVRQRRSRAALVVASIALGVATLVATRTLNQSMKKATRGAVTPMAGVGDLLVGNGDHGVDRNLAADLVRAGVPGVKTVQPLVVGRAFLPDLANRPATILGVELRADAATAKDLGIEVKPTNPLAFMFGQTPAFVGVELAQALPPRHTTLRVRTAGRDHRLAIAGTVDAKGPAATLGGSVVYLDLQHAAGLLGRPDYVSRIDISLEPGADRDQVKQRLEQLLGGRASVRFPEANDGMVRDVLGGIELGFTLSGLGALVVGLFLVYNALAVSVAERRHDIGILRSSGATRAQIAGLIAGEAAVLGFLGACLGVPLGKLLADWSAGPIRQALSDIFLPIEAGQRVSLTVGTAATAVVAGVLTALGAALVPALQAAWEEPAAAVRRVPLLAGWGMRLLQFAASAGLVVAGIACFLSRAALPDRIGTFISVSLVLLGGLLATPLLAAIAARLLRPFARSCLGVAGRLAADNLARSAGRTGLVIGALAAGTALLIENAGLTLSSEHAVIQWVDETFLSDLTVTANSRVAGSGDSQEMDERLAERFASVPGVESVVPVRFRRPFLGDKIVFVIAVDAVAYYEGIRKRGQMRGMELFPLLEEPGTVVVSDNFAARHGARAGDKVTLPGRRGPVELRILGTMPDYSWSQGTLIMDRQRYKELFDDPLVDAFDIFVKPEADTETVRRTISHRFGTQENVNLVVLTRTEVRQEIVDMIRRLYSIAYAQQVVVIVVAGLGVVMALLISVLQRRRELGLLRAVGASQFQVVRSILAEAALLGLIGAAIGVLVGIPLEWYAVRVLLFEETGFVFPVSIPWRAAGQIVGAVMAVAIASGMFPAFRAMRLRITEAIAYE
jgi:putative ABC transport system permease protein